MEVSRVKIQIKNVNFPSEYESLTNSTFKKGKYRIVPIRYQDRFEIMKWRNQQMFHLRQSELLTKENQENYFTNTISELFIREKPNQLLFSYLENNVCIGYGGLVHINWIEKNAEISFIMDTVLESQHFEFHWSNYLFLIKKVAFNELSFDEIYTYAYDLRPHLYPVLEKNEFKLHTTLKNKLEVNGEKVDVLIHKCLNPLNYIEARDACDNDMDLVFEWSNDELVRSQSFNSAPILYDKHKEWFTSKLNSHNSLMFINEYHTKPIGLVRFELEKENSTVGVLVSKEMRGKGLSSLILIKSLAKYFSNNNIPVFAYIKKTNQASVRAFEKAGFSFSHDTLINEIPTFVYKIERNESK